MNEVEYGSIQPIRFSKGIMKDGMGRLIKCCKCDKAAAAGIVGKQAHIMFCSEHYPISCSEAYIVYKEPEEEK